MTSLRVPEADTLDNPIHLATFASVAPQDAMHRAALILRSGGGREHGRTFHGTAAQAWDMYRSRRLATEFSKAHHPGLAELVASLAALPKNAPVVIRHVTSETGLLSLVWDQSGKPLGLVTPQGRAAAPA